jgi:hypothetical protein
MSCCAFFPHLKLVSEFYLVIFSSSVDVFSIRHGTSTLAWCLACGSCV